MEGPKWGNHWTAAPSEAVRTDAEIGLDIYADATSSSPAWRAIKEGALKLSLALKPKSRQQATAGNVTSGNGTRFALPGTAFDSVDFRTRVARSLKVSDVNRVILTDVSLDQTKFNLTILPLPLAMYTEEFKSRQAANAGVTTAAAEPTNAELQVALRSSTSSVSAALAADTQAQVSDVALETQRGPSSAAATSGPGAATTAGAGPSPGAASTPVPSPQAGSPPPADTQPAKISDAAIAITVAVIVVGVLAGVAVTLLVVRYCRKPAPTAAANAPAR